MQHEADRVVIEDDRFNPGKTWYIESPSDFLGGDKSLAYNGWLTFELGHFEYESMMEPLISDYDIILVRKLDQNPWDETNPLLTLTGVQEEEPKPWNQGHFH